MVADYAIVAVEVIAIGFIWFCGLA